MKTWIAATVLAALAAAATPASASVTYELDAFLAGFKYQAPGFIDALSSIDGATTDYCGVVIASCRSLVFEPGSDLEATQDRVTMNVALPFAFGGSDETVPFTFTFDRGAFGREGIYESNGEWAGTLTVSGTVSAVPLPATAPLFGAAILVLGAAAGLRRNRMSTPV